MEKTIALKLLIALLLCLTSCKPRNILVLPSAVDKIISEGMPSQIDVCNDPKPLLFFQVEIMDDGAYLILFRCSTRETTSFKKLISNSGRFVLIGGKRYPLVDWEDEELSLLSAPTGEYLSLWDKFISFDGLWVIWQGAQIRSSSLDGKKPAEKKSEE